MNSHDGEPNYKMNGETSGDGGGMGSPMAHTAKEGKSGGEMAPEAYTGKKE